MGDKNTEIIYVKITLINIILYFISKKQTMGNYDILSV